MLVHCTVVDEQEMRDYLRTLETLHADCPEWVYVFVKPDHPLATMNLMITGVFSSSVNAAIEDPEFVKAYAAGTPDFMPFVPNPQVSMGFMSAHPIGGGRESRGRSTVRIGRLCG